MVTLVPGGPSLGEIPVTWGGGFLTLLSIISLDPDEKRINQIQNTQVITNNAVYTPTPDI